MNSERLIKKLLREDVEDASKLLGLAINKTQEQLFANLDYEINSSEFIKFLSLVDQRKDGKPFAYIKGSQGFYDNEFFYPYKNILQNDDRNHLVLGSKRHLYLYPKSPLLDFAHYSSNQTNYRWQSGIFYI